MSNRGRKPAPNHFPVTLPLLEDAWNGVECESGEPFLSSREKNIYLKKAVEAYAGWEDVGDRPAFSSFLHQDCDSSFSVKIPRSSFKGSLARFVHHRYVKGCKDDFVFYGEKRGRKSMGKEAKFEAEETCRKLQSVCGL